MRVRKHFFLLMIGIAICSFTGNNTAESGYLITKRMFDQTSKINSLIYTLSKEERINGEMIKQVSFTKMESKPFKVYMKQLFPKEGMEVLYIQGANNDKAIINPNGFPWINIKLNPTEGIMRDDQHHTIFQSGFDHVVSILEFLCTKYQSDIEQIAKFNGTLMYADKECYSISFDNPNFKYIDYTVLGDETLEDIALKYKLSEHMILEKNPSIRDYDDVEAGQIIKIPNDYSPKMLIYIDKYDLIPLRMDVYDDQGLYEKYEYSKVTINPQIPSAEFSKDYSKYGF